MVQLDSLKINYYFLKYLIKLDLGGLSTAKKKPPVSDMHIHTILLYINKAQN